MICTNNNVSPRQWNIDRRLTFAVLHTTFLQSSSMLTDHASRWYVLFLNSTTAPVLLPALEIKVAKIPKESVCTLACITTSTWEPKWMPGLMPSADKKEYWDKMSRMWLLQIIRFQNLNYSNYNRLHTF